MIKNYFLIAWRSLLKNKLFSFINIFGLALSMSVCMIVLIRIVDSLEYDNFHADRDTIYRVISKISNEEGRTWRMASTPLPLAATIQDDSTIVVPATLFYPAIHQEAKDGSLEFAVNGIFAQPSYFTLFGFTLKYGDVTSALTNPGQVLLSQTTAEKFYGALDPTGRTMTLGTLGDFEITGVVNTPPSKSHINYDVIVSMATVPSLEHAGLLPKKYDVWNSFEQGYTYVRLPDETAKQGLQGSLDRLSAEITKTATQGSYSFELQPLSSITPGGDDVYNDIGRGPSRGSLLAEAGIVMIILLAACFNYTNLSVARALTRSKEVGIRKLSGAQRWQIFVQYITEAVIIAMLALFLANVILAPILEFKPFNDGYEMVPSVTLSFKLLAVFMIFAVFAGILAGAFPAWILSAFKPARILRGIGSEKLMGNLSLRKTLMVFQFSLSLIILVFLSTFYQQFDFIANADPGFNRDNIILIPAGSNKQVTSTSLGKLHGISNIGFTSDPFGSNRSGSVKGSQQATDEQATMLEQYYCDNNWISMMKLELLAGTYFLSDTDSSIIVNEKGAHALGFENISDAVGSVIYLEDSLKTTVQGVVRDFYAQGYGNAIQPLMLRNVPAAGKFIALESSQTSPQFMAAVEQEWRKQNPASAFEYVWLDEEARKRNDQSAGISLLGFLGFMTVTIAAMGLLGLVVYTVETRRKEISIRKIIGASVQQITTILSGSFVKLLVLSGIIALPVGYLLSRFFLMNFVNQVSIGVLDLLACFGFLMLVGLLTILPQTWRASQENPSRNLRSE
jgi:putative ABC transport system permease protein